MSQQKRSGPQAEPESCCCRTALHNDARVALGGAFPGNLGDFPGPIGIFRGERSRLRGHILNVRRDPPLISECILHRTTAIAIWVVSELRNRRASRRQCSAIE